MYMKNFEHINNTSEGRFYVKKKGQFTEKVWKDSLPSF